MPKQERKYNRILLKLSGEALTGDADFGIDPYWMSHEPWIVAEPFTPEAGELWSKEDIDMWIGVIAQIVEEARTNPEFVKTAPHNQAIAQVKGDAFEDPAKWAMME